MVPPPPPLTVMGNVMELEAVPYVAVPLWVPTVMVAVVASALPPQSKLNAKPASKAKNCFLMSFLIRVIVINFQKTSLRCAKISTTGPRHGCAPVEIPR